MQTHSKHSIIEYLYKLLTNPELKLQEVKGARSVIQHLMLAPYDKCLWQILREIIRKRKLEILQDDDPFRSNRPSSDFFRPPFPRGSVPFFLVNRQPFPFHVSCLNQGAIVTGKPGVGKTSLARVLLTAVAVADSGGLCIAFENKKTGELIGERLLNSKLEIYTLKIAEIPICPFQPPPGVSLREHATRIASLIAGCFSLIASRRVISSELLTLYKTPRQGFPRWSELTRALQKKKGRGYSTEERYAETAYLAFQDALVNGRFLDAAESNALDEIAKLGNAIVTISTESLAEQVAGVVVSVFMNYSYQLRKHVDKEMPLLVYAYDDALLGVAASQRNEEQGFISPIADISRMARAFNQGTLISSQNYSVISPVLRQNCNTLIALNSSGNDARQLSLDMNLTPEQAKLIPVLDKGECILFSPLFWKLPVRLRFPFLP